MIFAAVLRSDLALRNRKHTFLPTGQAQFQISARIVRYLRRQAEVEVHANGSVQSDRAALQSGNAVGVNFAVLVDRCTAELRIIVLADGLPPDVSVLALGEQICDLAGTHLFSGFSGNLLAVNHITQNIAVIVAVFNLYTISANRRNIRRFNDFQSADATAILNQISTVQSNSIIFFVVFVRIYDDTSCPVISGDFATVHAVFDGALNAHRTDTAGNSSLQRRLVLHAGDHRILCTPCNTANAAAV